MKEANGFRNKLIFTTLLGIFLLVISSCGAANKPSPLCSEEVVVQYEGAVDNLDCESKATNEKVKECELDIAQYVEIMNDCTLDLT